MRPAVGASSPASTRSSVDFPHPFGPMTATSSPSPTDPLSPPSAVSGSPWVGKVTVRSVTVIAVGWADS